MNLKKGHLGFDSETPPQSIAEIAKRNTLRYVFNLWREDCFVCVLPAVSLNGMHRVMNINTPVIFSDGTSVFKKLASQYRTHSKGLFILAPSGSGKSYYVNSQKDTNWIDGDYLWPLCGADTTSDEWNYDFSIVMETNNRCDVITEQAKKFGFWIIGSSNHWLRPDAIVLPHWSTHKRYIRERENADYDGGATEIDLQGVLKHRQWIRTWKKSGVPCLESVQKAVSLLESVS